MRYRIYILLIVSFFSCSKTEKEEELNTIEIILINQYWDSMYVTTINHTHSQFSIAKKGIPGQPRLGYYQSMSVNAVENDSITYPTLLKFANKFGRHPLLLKEFAYTVGRRAPYRGTPYFNAAPAGSFIEIQTQNTSNMFVTAMLVHDGKEDSLFVLEPQSVQNEFQTIGYFKTADTSNIKNPLVKFYFGQNPPFTTTISTLPLWGSGASNTVSSTEPYTKIYTNQIYVPIKR